MALRCAGLPLLATNERVPKTFPYCSCLQNLIPDLRSLAVIVKTTDRWHGINLAQQANLIDEQVHRPLAIVSAPSGLGLASHLQYVTLLAVKPTTEGLELCLWR